MKRYKRIRDLREDKDITQEKLAKHLGISQRAYSRYETADSMMPLDLLIKIADFYNVSVDYLLERTDIPNRYPHK